MPEPAARAEAVAACARCANAQPIVALSVEGARADRRRACRTGRQEGDRCPRPRASVLMVGCGLSERTITSRQRRRRSRARIARSKRAPTERQPACSEVVPSERQRGRWSDARSAPKAVAAPCGGPKREPPQGWRRLLLLLLLDLSALARKFGDVFGRRTRWLLASEAGAYRQLSRTTVKRAPSSCVPQVIAFSSSRSVAATSSA